MPRLTKRESNGYRPSEVSSIPPGFSSRPHGFSSESESESDSEDERHVRSRPRKSYSSAITQFPKKKKKYVHPTISKDCTAGKNALCVELLAELGKKNVPYSMLSGGDPEMSHSRRISIRDTERKTDLEENHPPQPRYLQFELRNAHDGQQSQSFRGVHSGNPDHSDDSPYTGLSSDESMDGDDHMPNVEEDNSKEKQTVKEPSSKERRSPYRPDPLGSKMAFAMEYIRRKRENNPTSYNDGPAAPVPPRAYSPLTDKVTRNRAGYFPNQYHDREHDFTEEEDDTQPVPTMRSGSFKRVQSDVMVPTINTRHHGIGETVSSGFIPSRMHELNEEKLWNLSQGGRENHIQRSKQYF